MAIFRAVVSIADPSLGGVGVNVWHGRTGPDEAVSVDALLAGLQAFYQDISDIFPSTTTLSQDGTGTTIHTASPALVGSGDAWSVAGTGGTHPTAPTTCIVAGWTTELRTRSGRGRTFLNPLDRDQVQDNGTPYESTRTMIRDAGLALIDTFAGAGDGALGVWSPTDEVLRDFTGCQVRNVFGVLRSRRD